MNNSPINVFGNLLSPYGAQNKDIDAISQTSLTGVRLRLRHRLSLSAYKDGAYREYGIYQWSSRTYPMGNPICCKMPVAGGSGMWDFFASSSSFCSAAPSSASPSILSATPRYMLTAFAISFRSIFGYTDTCGAGGGGRGMELCFSLNLLTVPVARSLGRNISLITLLLRSRGMETKNTLFPPKFRTKSHFQMPLGELLFQNNDLRKISGANRAFYEGIEKNQQIFQ